MYLFLGKGVKVENRKKPAIQKKIETPPLGAFACVPLFDHGRGPENAAEVGSKIEKYSLLSEGKNPVYAPVAGIVSGLEVIDHPLLGKVTCSMIAVNKKATDRGVKRPAKQEFTAEELVQIAHDAGIIDEYDGVPLHVKLRAFAERAVSLVVADAIDDEPYVSSGIATVLHMGKEVADGIQLVQKASGNCETMIALYAPGTVKEIWKVKKKLDGVPVTKVTGKYPVWSSLEKIISPYGRPIGKVGVQACAAFSRAVRKGEPQLDCMVTMAGDGLRKKVNLRVPVGTPVSYLMEYCGACKEPSMVVMGNSMNGVSITDTNTPVVIGARCILVTSGRIGPKPHPCIGCGRCNDVCAMGLLPGTIAKFVERGDMESIQKYGVERCNGCGACSVVCPARLELSAMMDSLQMGKPVELYDKEVR